MGRRETMVKRKSGTPDNRSSKRFRHENPLKWEAEDVAAFFEAKDDMVLREFGKAVRKEDLTGRLCKELSNDDIEKMSSAFKNVGARKKIESQVEQLFDPLMIHFLEYDTDGSGALDAYEMQKKVLPAAGIDDPAAAKKMIKEADLDGDGLVDFHEFRTIMRDHKKGGGEWDSLRSRTLTVGDALYFALMLTVLYVAIVCAVVPGIVREGQLAPTPTMAAADHAREADVNGDGKISRAEFIKIMETKQPLGPSQEKDTNMLLLKADTDKNGHVSYDEFIKVMQKPKLPADHAREADTDGDGVITKKETIEAVKEMAAEHEENAETVDAPPLLLAFADTNKDGKLSFDEVKKIKASDFANYPGPAAVIKQMDPDGDGNISYNDFIKAMKA